MRPKYIHIYQYNNNKKDKRVKDNNQTETGKTKTKTKSNTYESLECQLRDTSIYKWIYADDKHMTHSVENNPNIKAYKSPHQDHHVINKNRDGIYIQR